MKMIVLLIITFSVSTLLQAQQLLTKDQQEVQQTVIKMFETLSIGLTQRFKENK